ncbi:hypothetical protein CKAN_00426100 [Cinnamomum micranthum f. kanehirae]|uniref:Uncharacterized protein n=1 Tax=Cinnamomum micranthum f. kanehirae TaxID=337451 RepID=A0A3S3M2F8_9MAGN|nr:hypothetical protein CKAN_00426100 [Cinnamomum micranthum f. kanehirae]
MDPQDDSIHRIGGNALCTSEMLTSSVQRDRASALAHTSSSLPLCKSALISSDLQIRPAALLYFFLSASQPSSAEPAHQHKSPHLFLSASPPSSAELISPSLQSPPTSSRTQIELISSFLSISIKRRCKSHRSCSKWLHMPLLEIRIGPNVYVDVVSAIV